MIIFLYLIILVLAIAPFYLISTSRKIKEIKALEEWKQSQRFTTLEISVPRNNDKAPLAAEQMFASIHGIYSEKAICQQHMSFEIVARDKYIQFYVYVPVDIRDFVMGQIYAQYPTVEIKETDDYHHASDLGSRSHAICELTMTKPDVYPIKLFGDFEVDPLSGITSVMTNLDKDEEVWLQTVIRPVGDEWQDKGNKIINEVRSGKKQGTTGLFGSIISGTKLFAKMVFWQAVKPGTEVAAKPTEIKLSGTVEEALKGIEFKIMKLGFESHLRVLSIASDSVSAKVKCQNVAAAFKQFNTTHLNGFKIGDVYTNDQIKWEEFVHRDFSTKGDILNISELASIFHLPHETVSTPSIVWSGSKKGEPPANLPLRESVDSKEITIIGETTFRGSYEVFGIKRDDRRRHIYIIGKSGVGKSVLIENMAIDDVIEDRGVIVVDPHGDLADKILSIVPDHRVSDVIVFDPADRAHPIAFNLLEHVDDDFKGMVASGFVGIFKKIFGESWGPRLEHILRNTVLALLDYPKSTMLDIPKMLTDNHFREKVVAKVKDPVIRDFWINEFAQYDSKFRTEAVSPILNKVGQFLSTSTIRNIVGQPHSKIDIREIMDQQKIMVVNLSRGKIGEDNSALLGAMMVTKIQLAAMSRADVTIDQRPDCYLYVDEFQNFATDSFSTILAEARKYNLNLTIANQYIAQLPEGVRDAVFGNAGTIICFRVGGSDADFLVKEYEPVFEVNDLVNLDKYNIYIKLLIDGISSQAFSARTLPPVQKLSGNGAKVLEYSRKTYSTDRSIVEEQIINRARQEEEEARKEAELFKQGGLEALLAKKGATLANEPKDGAFVQVQASRPQESTEPAKRSEEMPPVGENQQTKFVPDSSSINDQASAESRMSSEDTPDKPKKKKKKVFRYQNIIGDILYKEQTARGGVRWFIGEPVTADSVAAAGSEAGESARKMIALARQAAGLPLLDLSSVPMRGTGAPKNEENEGPEESKDEKNTDIAEKTEGQDAGSELHIDEEVRVVDNEPIVTAQDNDRLGEKRDGSAAGTTSNNLIMPKENEAFVVPQDGFEQEDDSLEPDLHKASQTPVGNQDDANEIKEGEVVEL